MLFIDILLAVFCLFTGVTKGLAVWAIGRVPEMAQENPEMAERIRRPFYLLRLKAYRLFMVAASFVTFMAAPALLVEFEPNLTGPLLVAFALVQMIVNALVLFRWPTETIAKMPVLALMLSILALPALLAGWRLMSLA